MVHDFHHRYAEADLRVSALGFGWRGSPPEHCFIAQFDPGTHAPSVPEMHCGYRVVLEEERVIPLGYWGDRLRRTFRPPPHEAWPGWAGCLLRAEDLRKGGTLGCFLKPQRGPERYALTCAHTLVNGEASDAYPRHGLSVYASIAGRKIDETLIGTAARAHGWESVAYESDAAVVLLRDASRAINVIPRIGRLAPKALDTDSIKIGHRVVKYGAASGYTSGVITAIKTIGQRRDSSVVMPLADVIEVAPRFDDEVRSTSFCDRGDSGSIVVMDASGAADREVLGLLASQGTLLQRGYVVPLVRILNGFSLSLV
jgi:hypothetical protein